MVFKTTTAARYSLLCALAALNKLRWSTSQHLSTASRQGSGRSMRDSTASSASSESTSPDICPVDGCLRMYDTMGLLGFVGPHAAEEAHIPLVTHDSTLLRCLHLKVTTTCRINKCKVVVSVAITPTATAAFLLCSLHS